MPPNTSDLYTLIDKIRYDCSAIQAKVTDLKKMLGGLNLPTEGTSFSCPRCGLEITTEEKHRDHMVNVHGEEPRHCERCGQDFNTVEQLADHLVFVHEIPGRPE